MYKIIQTVKSPSYLALTRRNNADNATDSGMTKPRAATGRHVYGEWDDMKNRGRKAARSGAEKIVERHLGPDRVRIGVADEAARSDERQTDGLLRLRHGPERLELLLEIRIGSLVNRIGSGRNR